MRRRDGVRVRSAHIAHVPEELDVGRGGLEDAESVFIKLGRKCLTMEMPSSSSASLPAPTPANSSTSTTAGHGSDEGENSWSVVSHPEALWPVSQSLSSPVASDGQPRKG